METLPPLFKAMPSDIPQTLTFKLLLQAVLQDNIDSLKQICGQIVQVLQRGQQEKGLEMYAIMQHAMGESTILETKRGCVQIVQMMLNNQKRLLNIQFLVPEGFVEFPAKQDVFRIAKSNLFLSCAKEKAINVNPTFRLLYYSLQLLSDESFAEQVYAELIRLLDDDTTRSVPPQLSGYFSKEIKLRNLYPAKRCKLFTYDEDQLFCQICLDYLQMEDDRLAQQSYSLLCQYFNTSSLDCKLAYRLPQTCIDDKGQLFIKLINMNMPVCVFTSLGQKSVLSGPAMFDQFLNEATNAGQCFEVKVCAPFADLCMLQGMRSQRYLKYKLMGEAVAHLTTFQPTDVMSMQLFTTNDLDQLYRLRRLSRLTKTTAQFEFITKDLKVDHGTVKLFIKQQLREEMGNVARLEQTISNRLISISGRIDQLERNVVEVSNRQNIFKQSRQQPIFYQITREKQKSSCLKSGCGKEHMRGDQYHPKESLDKTECHHHKRKSKRAQKGLSASFLSILQRQVMNYEIQNDVKFLPAEMSQQFKEQQESIARRKQEKEESKQLKKEQKIAKQQQKQLEKQQAKQRKEELRKEQDALKQKQNLQKLIESGKFVPYHRVTTDNVQKCLKKTEQQSDLENESKFTLHIQQI